MKQKTSLTLTAISLAAGLLFANCKKEHPGGLIGPKPTETSTPSYSFRYQRTPDRLDEIVRDLALDQYSFNFDAPNKAAGITRTAYGADNYLVYADPQDLICPEPLRFKYKKIPVWKIPHYIQPTCPDMIIDIQKFKEINQLLAQANPEQFGNLREIGLSNGGALFAGKEFFNQYANLQPDMMDKLTDDLDPEKYIMFHAPGDYSREFSRSFYGYADLYENVFKRYEYNWKDLLKPTLKGCFDPIILETILKRLQEVNPAVYEGLNVTPLDEAGNAAVLSF